MKIVSTFSDGILVTMTKWNEVLRYIDSATNANYNNCKIRKIVKLTGQGRNGHIDSNRTEGTTITICVFFSLCNFNSQFQSIPFKFIAINCWERNIKAHIFVTNSIEFHSMEYFRSWNMILAIIFLLRVVYTARIVNETDQIVNSSQFVDKVLGGNSRGCRM